MEGGGRQERQKKNSGRRDPAQSGVCGRRLTSRNLLDEDGREVLPGDDPVIHQLHEGRQRVGHDHVAPGGERNHFILYISLQSQ